MTSSRNAQDNGKLVLDIYAHFGSRAGEVLRANNFVAVAARRRMRMSDVQQGLEYAARKGWVEKTENGSLRLTERGFKALPHTSQTL